jgi:caspase domain-containing protein/putative peptidoglycan binding protein
MRAWLLWVLFLAGAAAAFVPATPAFADKRAALVIGNSAYQKAASLPNPVNDARAVGEVFKRAGFDVVDIRYDLDGRALRQAVRDFSLVTRDADVAIIFYAGHGIEFAGSNYIIPTDAKLEWDFDIEDETVSLDRMLKTVETAKRLRLIILDACRDNPFVASTKRTVATRSISRGLAKIEPMSSDTLIAFAAKAGSVAEDGGGTHSPFTTALLKHIAVPGLDVRFAFGRVRDEVLKATGNRQEPFVYGSLGGDTVSIVPPVPMAAADEVTWDLLKGTKDPDQLRRFVEQFPNSQRRADAEQRIAALAAGEPAAARRPELPDRGELARALQLELKRVGCFEGAVDGAFGDPTRAALRNFARHAAIRLPDGDVSTETVKAVRGFDKRICPLVCRPDERADGERCVRIVCPRGEVLKDGACVGNVASETTRPAVRDVPQAGPASQAGPPPQAAPAVRPPGGGKCFSFQGRQFCE